MAGPMIQVARCGRLLGEMLFVSALLCVVLVCAGPDWTRPQKGGFGFRASSRLAQNLPKIELHREKES